MGQRRLQTAAEDAGIPEDSNWDLTNRIPLGNTEVSPVNQALALLDVRQSGRAAQGARRG